MCWMNVARCGSGHLASSAPLMYELLGVIPRAASALFEKLAGPPTLKRSGSSGLRTPTRYSVQSSIGLAALAKAQAQASEDKNWQMKATYVEVGFSQFATSMALLKSLSDIQRATTRSSGTRIDTSDRTNISGYPRGRERSHSPYRTPPGQYKFHRRSLSNSEFRIFDSAD